MTIGMNLTRRITLATLVGIATSTALVVFVSVAFWRIAPAPQRLPANAPAYAASILLAESAYDPEFRNRVLDTLLKHDPNLRLAVYTQAGERVASTSPQTADALGRPPKDWNAFEVEPAGDRERWRIPLTASSGARFFAVHDAVDKPAPASVVWWLSLACAVPVFASVAASLLLARSLTRPIDRIVTTARALADGELSARTAIVRHDELGLLASTLDRMAEQVTALLRSRTEFLALVSHELRTPLARIRVALDIARVGDGEAAQRLLPSIGLDLAELERLLADTLAYTRLELVEKGGGSTPLNLEEFDPVPMLEEAAARFRSSWPDRSLSLELEPDLPLLVADRVLLLRMVVNLLENAAKYSPLDRPILLRASHAADLVELNVVDAGAGIDERDVPYAFDPFFRSRTARAGATTGGLGLGLTLCRRVVEAHAGTIEACRTRAGGTTMRVVLPAATPAT